MPTKVFVDINPALAALAVAGVLNGIGLYGVVLRGQTRPRALDLGSGHTRGIL